MRRIAALLTALLLVLAACGGDSSGDEPDQTTTTTAADAATTTTAASATTTTAAPTTTEEPSNPAMETALALEGSYEGEWNNTTFGSTGPVELVISVDEAGGFAIVTLDLGGNVFGGSDPDPVLWEVDLLTGELFSGDDLFGQTTAEFAEDGSFTLTAPEVPGLGLEMIVEGTASGDAGFSGTYTITGLAEGTFEAIPSN